MISYNNTKCSYLIKKKRLGLDVNVLTDALIVAIPTGLLTGVLSKADGNPDNTGNSGGNARIKGEVNNQPGNSPNNFATTLSLFTSEQIRLQTLPASFAEQTTIRNVERAQIIGNLMEQNQADSPMRNETLPRYNEISRKIGYNIEQVYRTR